MEVKLINKNRDYTVALYRSPKARSLSNDRLTPSGWINAGMQDSILSPAPEYLLPADLADMVKPQGMTRYQLKLMHLLFAEICQNRNPKIKLCVKAISNFISSGERTVAKSQLIPLITEMSDMVFTFMSGGLRQWNLNPIEVNLFSFIFNKKDKEIEFVVNHKVWEKFTNPKIYTYISLKDVSLLKSEAAICLLSITQVKNVIRSQRNKYCILKEYQNHFSFATSDISEWIGANHKEPARLISELKRAAKSIEKLNIPGFYMSVIGLKKDSSGKIISETKKINKKGSYKNKDTFKDKFIEFKFTTPPKSIWNTKKDIIVSDGIHNGFKLRSAKAININRTKLVATFKELGWEIEDQNVIDFFKYKWKLFAIDAITHLRDDNIKKAEIYANFHSQILLEFSQNGLIPEIDAEDFNEVEREWQKLNSKLENSQVGKPSGFNKFMKSKRIEIVEDDFEVIEKPETNQIPIVPTVENINVAHSEERTHHLGIKLNRTPIAKHPEKSTFEIGQEFKRDPRKSDEIYRYNGITKKFEIWPSDCMILRSVMNIQDCQIPFFEDDELWEVNRLKPLPGYIKKLMEGRKLNL